MRFAGLFFVTCTCHHFCTGHPYTNRGIFTTPLNQNKWMKQLENPCQAPINSETNQTILKLDGRQAEIRIMAGNMKSRLGLIKNYLVSKRYA